MFVVLFEKTIMSLSLFSLPYTGAVFFEARTCASMLIIVEHVFKRKCSCLS